MKFPKLTLLAALVLGAAACRLLPQPENVAPIAAMALLAAAYAPSFALALVLPLAALLLSDLIIGTHPGMIVVYGAVVVSALISWKLIRPSITPLRILGGTLLSSVAFFLITNNVFLYGGTLYTADFDGMMQSYIAGLPFFRNTVMGDLAYSAALFTIAHFALNPATKTAK